MERATMPVQRGSRKRGDVEQEVAVFWGCHRAGCNNEMDGMTKRSLVIGIDDYSGIDPSGKSNLGSCVADANNVYELLISAFGFDPDQSTKFTDQQASSSAIQLSLSNLIAKSGPGDVICFYYSGHGSTAAANPNQDCEKFFQTIVPASGRQISDATLFKIASKLQQSVVNFTVILDSCHSGGMDQETDAVLRCKSLKLSDEIVERIQEFLHTLIPCGICIPASADVCDNNVSNVSVSNGCFSLDEDSDKVFVPLAKTTLIAGCKFNELSWETGGHGLLTKSLLDLVNASNFQISYRDILDELETRVSDYFNTLILPTIPHNLPRSQTPQLRGQANRMDEGFLQGWMDSS